MSWLSFDVDLTFDDGVTGKEMTLTPTLDFGEWGCIDIYSELVVLADDIEDANFYRVRGINFYGVGFEANWNGVKFESLSALDWPYHWVTTDIELDTDYDTYQEALEAIEDVLEDYPYWEVFVISSEADSCCVAALEFNIATFFSQSSEMLFDSGKSEVDFSMGLGSNFDVNAGFVVTEANAFDEMSVGFTVLPGKLNTTKKLGALLRQGSFSRLSLGNWLLFSNVDDKSKGARPLSRSGYISRAVMVELQ
jgi:hypothetical protein